MRSRLKKSGVRGTSPGVMTTEFLVLGPSLVALMYIAYAANDYIQRRQVLSIATRNAANIYMPGVDTAADDPNNTRLHLQHSFKVDMLGADRADEIIDVITDQGLAQAIATDAPAVVTLNERHLSAYQARPIRYDSAHEFDGKRLESGGPISGTLGTAVHLTTLAYDSIVNFYVPVLSNKLRILFDDRPMETRMHMAMRGDADFFSQALLAVTNFWGKDTITERSLQSIHAIKHFQRVQAGYHPETYRMQFFIGWVLGKSGKDQPAWGNNPNGFKRNILANFLEPLPGYFATECMFNLRGGENCRTPLMVAKLWNILASVKAIVCVIQDIFGGGSCSESKLAYDMAEKALEKLFGQIATQIEEQVTASAKEFVDQKVKELKDSAVEEVKRFVGTVVEDQLKQFANGIFSEEDEP